MASFIKFLTFDCSDDLRAPGPVPEEVARLVALGARVVAENGDLVVMQDPDGNEFCVE